jgi:hypothetical protein
LRRLTTLALGVAAACGGGAKTAPEPAKPAAGGRTPAEIAEIALPSVVLIKTPTELGTGFVIWKDGRIATNLHVLAGANEATVTLNDGRVFTDVMVMGADPAHDLAVIRIPVDDLKALPLGDSTTVRPGERVVAIGHPLGLGNTISDGLVSGVRELNPRLTLLQITAPIAPGSSGGPIFNDRAEVIGVATLFSSEGQNLNFGVPVAYLKPLLLSERPLPLSAFAKELDATLLDGCSGEEVKLVVSQIADALSLGVPQYNKGDHQACFDTYQGAALKLVGALKGCQRVRETLLAGVTSANRADTPSDKAWAMRHAFDRVLNAFNAAVDQIEKENQP